MIEINLRKLERGVRTELRTVKRGGKVFQRKTRVGRKEKVDKGVKPREVVEDKKLKVKETKTIDNFENNIKDQKFETCGVFNENGDFIFSKDGEEDYIGDFTYDEIDKFEGAISTHNHPRNHSFSKEDVHLACQLRVREERVITSKGKVFSLKRTNGEKLYIGMWLKIEPLFKKYNRVVENIFYKSIDSGEMSIKEANINHSHEVWTRVFNDMDELIYKVE